MRRKPINAETMVLIAGALLRRLHDDRFSDITPPKHWISVGQICTAVAQCGINPEALARACSINLGGWQHSAAIYDELDRELAVSVGEDFAAAFVEALANDENHFRQMGIPTY